jgi:ATP-dependent Clp protease adaptor protein ClpS
MIPPTTDSERLLPPSAPVWPAVAGGIAVSGRAVLSGADIFASGVAGPGADIFASGVAGPGADIFASGVAGPDKDDPGQGGGDDQQIGIATKTRAKPKKPSQFKVLMLNDDYTPMEFVVMVLKRFFNMDLEQATRVMLHVHQKGVGVCGIFPYEIAETKVNQVMDFARQNQHPLQCTLEKA